ncbi:hypothetical protein JMJ56_22385 [Belnapia sp. T18]|uniref:SGNH hydrolase-type esterase domain-containing protein n=1 Tax=Belnapia arida TaxID=2804533 RepID=A0ABS1U7V9_9PROT|nr:hypothetical protein [Belnapia arida]MBL6080768.1 hypothetical protein [Belnapia arida]
MREQARSPRAAKADAVSRAKANATPTWFAYLVSFLGSLAVMFALYYGSLLGLSATGNLPPPALTNSLCIDEKFAFMRQERPEAPNMLVVGSSVAWRHFDGDTMTHASPEAVPFNGGMCGRSINQTGYAAEWLLGHFGTVRDVLLIASPQDFNSCPASSTAFFDRGDVDDYVFGQANPWLLYTRYFSLVSLVRNALSIADKRSGADRVDPLVFDKYGSGPLGGDGVRGTLLYGKVAEADPACLEALSRLATKLRQEGRRFMVVSTPLHPEWRRLHDANGEYMGRLNAAIGTALAESGAEYWDSNSSPSLAASDFFDAIHLRWTAVPEFTGDLVKAFHLDRGLAGVSTQIVRGGA